MTWAMTWQAWAGVVAFAFALAASAGCDPVHDHAVTDLGDETPGVRRGPLHRPGQPCIVCHDGALGDPRAFTVAGTIFVDQSSLSAASGAVVTMQDHDGKTFESTANEAGNFYVSPQEFTPTYPMKVAVTYGGTTVKMVSLVGRNGSCSGCHTDPGSPSSPGHVFIPANGVAP
jgi:hypothetical protein